MNIFIFFAIFSAFAVLLSSGSQLNATVLAMYSLEGDLAFLAQILALVQLWQSHLLEKASSDKSFPFISVEFIDARSDPEYSRQAFIDRVNNRSLPNVTAVLGPETTVGSYVGFEAVNYGIPVVLVECDPDPALTTGYFVIPRTMYKCRALVDEYLSVGVRSLVAVVMLESYEDYNYNTCMDTADLAASRGIRVTKIIMEDNYSLDDVVSVVRKIRDSYNPDAVIWCDWAACQIDDQVFRNPLLAFKQVNYLPKSLTLMDCASAIPMQAPEFKSLFQYVTVGLLAHEKLRGADYTEAATPYSSHFRPKSAVNLTVNNLINNKIMNNFIYYQ